MRVLLLGVDCALGQALQSHLLRWGRHEVEALSFTASRWKSERQAKKAVRRAEPDAILDLRFHAANDAGAQLRDHDSDRSHWLAKACSRGDIIYFFVSSDRVFSGWQERLYREVDEPDAADEAGTLLRDAESSIRQACDSHLVLRLGQVFSHHGANALTQFLAHFAEGGDIALPGARIGCPVESGEAARVMAGMLDQVSAGAENWGNFHYCSSDPTNCYEFAEVVLAAASQYWGYDAESVRLALAPEEAPVIHRVLDCSRLRNHFAIKQVPWRGFVSAAVRAHYDIARQQEEE